MTARNTVALSILVALFMLFFIGCAPETKVETQTQPAAEEQAAGEEMMIEAETSPQDAAQAEVKVEEAVETAPLSVYTYKVNDLQRKDYQFNQPNADKSVEKSSELATEMVFDQAVKSIDEQGNTIAEITIKSLKYKNTSDDEVRIEFDSSNEANTQSSLAKLIGQSYTVKISPSGKVVEISDIESARSAVSSGSDATLAARLLNRDNIERRHEILSLPDEGYKSLSAESKWTRVVSSPRGVLMPKKHEKLYEVKEIINDARSKLALVEMSAVPTSKETKDSSNLTPAEVFSNFFDSIDTFTGRLLIDVNTGKVYDYSEDFKSKYTAAQLPKNAADANQPDVLELMFTQQHSLELVD